MISLQCEACHGTMDVDENREVLTCPYCGSKQLIPVSDAVKIEKIKNEAEIEKLKTKKEYDQEQSKRTDRTFLIMFAMVVVLYILTKVLR
ncbi:MAG: hypothetical protein K6E84_10365 [Lachnospiraceae bacterium]|nr:hypothetical protein [Lachnospiraceae bacterium]